MLHERVLVEDCVSLNNANIMLAVLLLRCVQKRQALKREIRREGEAFQCCRTCMRRDDLKPIFGDDDTPQVMAEQLLLTSGIQITKDDGLPQKICNGCINSMNEAIKFRNKCKRTEKSLLGLGFQRGNDSRRDEIRENEKRLAKISERLHKNESTHKTKSKLINKVKKKHLKKKKLHQLKQSMIDNELPDTNYEEDNFLDDPNDLQYESATDNTNIVELYHKNPSNISVAKRKDDVDIPNSLKCTTCDRVLKNKHTYVRHMVVHTGDYPYMCEQCGKGLMAYTHLVTHMKAKHGWERTDKCSFCGYLALNKSILQIHERRHTGEKPFICDHCGMGFHRRANLLQHLPVHLPDKTVQCDQCPAMFKSIRFMRIHKNSMHKASKYTYKCSICQNFFVRRNSVIKHLRRIHSLIGKDECSLCPSAFKSIRFLRTHYNKKHKQKKYTYTCHICKNYFKTTGNVRMHLFRIHGIPKEEQGPVHRVSIANSYLM